MNAAVLNMTIHFIVNGPLPMSEIAKAESIKTRKKYNTTALRADSMSIRHLGLSIVRTAHGPRLMRKRFDTLEEQMQEARNAGYIPGMMPTLWEIHHNTKRTRMTQQEERDAGEGMGYGAVAESMSRSFEDIDAKDFEPAYNSMPGGEPALEDDHTRLTDDQLLEQAARDAQVWMHGQEARCEAGTRRTLTEIAERVLDLDTSRWANRNKGQEADDIAHRIYQVQHADMRGSNLAKHDNNREWQLSMDWQLRPYLLAALEKAYEATTAQCAETDCSPQTSREPAPEVCAWRLRLELANKGMVARQEAPPMDFEGDYDMDYEEE